MDPAPEYDDTSLDKDIAVLHAEQPTSTDARTARDALLMAMKLSQKETFSKEISATMTRSLALKQSLETFLLSLRTGDDADPNITSAFDTAEKEYASLLWAAKRSATTSAGASSLGGFVETVLPMVRDKSITASDLEEELKYFIEALPAAVEIKGGTVTFEKLRSDLIQVEQLINERNVLGKETDTKAIKAAKAEVIRLESLLRRYKEEFRKLLPQYVRLMGMDEKQPKFALILALSPYALYDLLVANMTGTGKKIDALNRCKHKIEDIETELLAAREKVMETIKSAESAATKRTSWSTKLNELEKIVGQVDDVKPSLEILNKITDAVRTDVNAYITFLHSGDAKDESRMNEEMAKLEFSALLYPQLTKSLIVFANA